MSNRVAGYGNPYSKLVILGEAPGATEDKTGEPFVGKSGEMLDRIFTELGHPSWKSEFWTTNVFKYQPPNNNIKLIHEVCNPIQQYAELSNELQNINPNCILALGKTALEAVTSQTKLLQYRGSILYSDIGAYKVVASIHPANLVTFTKESEDESESFARYSYVWKWILASDIKKALHESGSNKLELVQRNLYSAKSSADVYNFIRRFRDSNRDRIFIDIETFGCTIPVCCSLAYSKHESISIPLIRNIKTLEITTQPTHDIAYNWYYLNKLFSDTLIAGQNLKFDQPKLEMYGFKFRGIKSDTSLKAWVLNPEIPFVNLGFLASLWSREPYWKDEGKEFAWGKHPVSRLLLYNAKDSAVDVEIDEELERELELLSQQYHTDLVDFYYSFIVPLHNFYSGIEKVGFRVDERQRNFLIDKYEVWESHLQMKIEVAVGREINLNSPKQVQELMYDKDSMGIKPIRKDMKTDEDTIAKILKANKYGNHTNEVLSDILEIRRVKKTLSTYLYAMSDLDGRLRTQYRITGTETGRSSTAVLDEPVRAYKCGFAFQTLTKHGDIGADIRSYLIADEGFVFVNIDLSQAEARVVAVLSKDWDLLDAFDHIDIHRRTAALALITGRLNLSYEFDPVADILGKDSSERFIGKKVRHAGNYDMGAGEFLTNVIADCRRFGINFTMSPYGAGKAIENFHKASPNIRGVFHKEVRDCVDTTRALVMPMGGLRRFFERPSEKLYKEAFAQIPQNTVGQRLKRSGMEIVARKFPIFRSFPQGESHDALVFQMPRGEAKDICREIKPIMEQPISFRTCSIQRDYDLIIPCDFEVGDDYKDMSKLKL